MFIFNPSFSKQCSARRRKGNAAVHAIISRNDPNCGCYFSIPTVDVVGQSPPSGTSIFTPEMSDQKLGAVAAAVKRVAGLQKDFQQRIAEAPAEKERIIAEAHNEFTKAVTDQGISVEEYGSILDVARDDPEIRDKILQLMGLSDE